MSLVERLRKIQQQGPYHQDECGEAADRIELLEGIVRELVSDITDSEHSPHDWSEQVVVKKARAALEEK